jgi:alkyldihydroxyacetonephosphate synthase
MRWWGWGDPDRRLELPPHALTWLRSTLDMPERTARPVPLEAVELEPPRLSGNMRERLTACVGAEHVRDDRHSRVLHAAGKGYADLVRMRAGTPGGAPDAVVLPQSEDEVRAVLEASVEQAVAVVPFGGGTSVVGGVEPIRNGFDSLITLDLSRMTGVSIDAHSQTAAIGAGLRGPEVEAALGESAFTLGHFPQSFEYATVGGWVATRSAGQASTGYGKIEEMVVGLTCITPEGEIESKPLPASAAGPQLRELVVGSEGVLGVITEATLRVRPRPADRRYEAWMFRGFSEGAEAFRRLEQRGAAPDVARLSDETETALTFQLAGPSGVSRRVAGAYMSARGYDGGCLAIVGFEGDRTVAAGRRSRATHMLRKAGGLLLGSRPGRAWERGRFDAPYLRDTLLDNCIMAETLETAAEWGLLMDLYGATREALRTTLEARGTPPLLMCHVSHLYPDGASLYFTFMAAQEEGAELEQWWAAKSAATEAILSAGGTLTHHHGVGRDHAAWLPREIGGLGVDLLRGAKQRLDPAGVMNPGKLLPPSGAGST